MGGIILIIIAVFITVMIGKVATVALGLTGLDKKTASFQALSALTRTGFTTGEAELAINNPMRRQVISFLMIIGNAGTVVIIGGFAFSFLTITSPWAILRFVVLMIGLYLIFKMATHTRLARILSKKIEEKLRERYKLQKKSLGKILDLGEGFGIAEVTLLEGSSFAEETITSSNLKKKKIMILAIERDKDKILAPRGNHKLHVGDNLICYGSFRKMKEIA